MKTGLTRITLLATLFIGSNAVFAQTKELPRANVEMKPEAQQFDEIKFQVVDELKQLNAMGVKEIPAYPVHISLESVTAYLEELKVLRQKYSPQPERK